MFGWSTSPGKTSIPDLKAPGGGGASISLGNLSQSSTLKNLWPFGCTCQLRARPQHPLPEERTTAIKPPTDLALLLFHLLGPFLTSFIIRYCIIFKFCLLPLKFCWFLPALSPARAALTSIVTQTPLSPLPHTHDDPTPLRPLRFFFFASSKFLTF